MNKIFIAFIFLSFWTISSAQRGEILIIEKDTFEINDAPIALLDEVTYDTFFKNIESTKEFLKLSYCVDPGKGYQGVWKIQNSSLYLVDLSPYHNAQNILKKVFPDKYKNGRVLASWFSSQIVIPRGKVLRSLDESEGFPSYLKEDILYFKSGKLINRIVVDNYTDLANGISRLNQEKLRETLESMIKSIDRPEMVIKYKITIDSNGKIAYVDFDGLHENYKHWQNYFIEKLRVYQFDIIKENGVPCSEKIYLEIF